MARLLFLAVTAALAVGSGFLLAQSPAKNTQTPATARGSAVAPAVQAASAPRVSTPPIPNPGFAPGRPVDVTRSVYDFAAQHPEILKYVPCYCGCESTGHPHNESCFVKTRDAKGNVTAWDTHGYG